VGSKGNLIILEGPDTIPSAAGRLRGFKDALKDAPNVKIILSKNALYARPAAADLLKAMLKANPNTQVDGVLAANDAMALGTVDAFKEAKKPLPLITGINAGKEAVDMIKAGDILASGDYNGLIDAALGAECDSCAARSRIPKKSWRDQVVDRQHCAVQDSVGDLALPTAK
jgi:ribose transport system substrate-binding protein